MIDKWRPGLVLSTPNYDGSKMEKALKSGTVSRSWRRFAIRYHSPGRMTRRRPFETAEVGLFPIHMPRSEWEKEPQDIGGILQTSEGKLAVTIDLAAGAYYSLIHSLSANQFKQLTLRHQQALAKINPHPRNPGSRLFTREE